MLDSHSTQIRRYQVSRLVKKNSYGYRSPIDRSNKRHGISLMGRVLTVMTRAGSIDRAVGSGAFSLRCACLRAWRLFMMPG
jgi:hypothetical protein